MKKLFTLFAAALVMLAAASCEKNEVLPGGNGEGKVVILKASINNGGTKTSLGKENEVYKTFWTQGDAIAVYQDETIFKFTLQGEGEIEEGLFALTEYDDCGYTIDNNTFNASESMIAFYPYSAFNMSSERTTFEIPQTQKYATNSFDNGAVKMIATGTGDDLRFTNLLGVVRLTIRGNDNEKVNSIVLTSDRQLWGTGQISYTNVSIYSDEGEQGVDYGNSITLQCNTPVAIGANSADFYIAVPEGQIPGEITNHPHSFEVVVHTNKGSYYKKASQANKIEAGNILNMPAISTANMAPAYIENGVCYGGGIALPAGHGKTIIWAPVNCGYDENHKYGLQYQWGRKYGQGYDGEIPAAVLENELIISVEAGSDEANKNNYYYKWLDSDSNSEDDYNMWYNNTPDATTTKTQYDPCPEGWRVPTNGELISLIYGLTEDHMTFGQQSHWATISDSNDKHDGLTGLWFYGNEEEPTDSSPKVFFPAAGYRYYIYSRSQYRDFMGNYWSSSRNQVGFAWGLEFHNSIGIEVRSTPILPNNGYSVRCVKE